MLLHRVLTLRINSKSAVFHLIPFLPIEEVLDSNDDITVFPYESSWIIDDVVCAVVQSLEECIS